MACFNKVLLMGNLTRDIEIRHTGGNVTVGNFGLAINRKFKKADGTQDEEVTFVDCTVWGRTAEVMAQYLSRGRPVFIEGHLKLDQWEDKNGGGKRSKISVVVENFQFISAPETGGSGQGDGRQETRPADTGGHGSGGAPRGEVPPDDDIPF